MSKTLMEALATSERPTGPPCGIIKLREQLDGDDLATFEQMLADGSVQGSRLARALNDIGYEVSGATIRRHRNGECRCDR